MIRMRIGTWRRGPVPLLALALALALLTGGTAPAAAARPAVVRPALAGPAADPADPAYPGTGDIDRAKADADRRAAAASALEAQLNGARTEVEQAGRRAEQAVEAYDGAQVRLTRARAAAADAAARAATAEQARADAAEQAAELAAASYRSGTSPELAAFDNLLGAGGPRAAADQAAGLATTVRSTRQILDDATSTARAAADARRAARADAAEAERAAAAVTRAKAQAEAQLAAQQQSVAELTKRHDHLLVELAAARNTTVELEQQRQSALEAIAAQQAAAAAKAAELAAENARKQSAPPALPAALAPWSEAGAQAAVAFARARLGLPYIWGGEGPDGYDCSGLTKLAWQQAGRMLPHFAADQYAASTPVSYGQLRPGDLVFWSRTGKPADIYHVAIYLGDDQVIMAPHPGGSIEQTGLWVMGGPNFFARP
jgi:cell wall-associated NlpC family hydrolase